MGKGKLAKFADMETYENVFQCPYSAVEDSIDLQSRGWGEWSYDLRGIWRNAYFKNQNPIVLELGCGKGEYTVELARQFPDMNFIGVDIKGARMWTGATQALNEGLKNVAFLRTNIEIIDHFFGEDEVQEIWLTFSDPQMKNPRKRLTSTHFMERYRRFLTDNGVIHLKTDSNFLYTYTTLMAGKNQLPVDFATDDLYGDLSAEKSKTVEGTTAPSFLLSQAPLLELKTYYEQMWIARGLTIKYIRFRLPHSTPLAEPDVEIELDEYRSYHRTKRSPLTLGK